MTVIPVNRKYVKVDLSVSHEELKHIDAAREQTRQSRNQFVTIAAMNRANQIMKEKEMRTNERTKEN